MIKRIIPIVILLVTIGITSVVFSQSEKSLSPIERSGFNKSTSYSDVVEFLDVLSKKFTNIHLEVIGNSVQSRKIYLVHVIPSTESKKIKVLLFAQIHGNEPSGKEVLLMLLNKISQSAETDILSNIDLYIIPLVNPDGNEEGKRANANGEDLNRDNLLLSQPEVKALHKAYMEIDPDVSLDIHEYSAFRKEFRNAGFVRAIDEEFGAPTNPNISQGIINFALKQVFPFLDSTLAQKGVSFSNYYKMESPDDTVRASSTAIGDGRQSMAILGSLSFILEGRAGRDMNADLKRRVPRQLIGVEKFVEFMNLHSEEIKLLVDSEKKRIAESAESVALKMDYVCDGSKIDMHMEMLDSNEPKVMKLPYASTVKVLESVNRPQAYIIPKKCKDVIEYLNFHDVQYIKTKFPHKFDVETYTITRKKKAWMENKVFNFPITSIRKETIKTEPGDIIVPLNQRAGLKMIIALEPGSMWGLSQTVEFNSLFEKGTDYPILRVPEYKGIEDE